MKAEVERVFSDHGVILDEKLVGECASICQMYAVTAEALLWKIQSINFTSSGPRSELRPITMDTLAEAKRLFQQSLTNSISNKLKLKQHTAMTTAVVNRSKLPTFAPRIPAIVKQEQLPELGSTVAQSGFVTTSNVTFIQVGHSNDLESRKKRKYRYMYEKISERSEVLDQIIDDFGDLIRNHYDLKAEFGDPSASTDEEVVIVGRITHDPETVVKSKLIEGAIFIESSRMLSGGARVPLRLDATMKIRGGVRNSGGFGLFPGKVAAFKGKNGGGGYFLATEYLSIPPLRASPTALGIVSPKLDPAVAQKPATMFVASGPYTGDTDLTYKPWRSLFNEMKAKKPDVTLLIGPFVDSSHPKIKIGDLDVSPSNLLQANFATRLKNFLDTSPGSMILLVPSVRDLVSDHAAFPQPELSPNLFPVHPRLYLLPNPARFTINDITFATTSVDSLFHLRKEEYFKRALDVEPLDPAADDLPDDAMAGLIRHLLLQRSFYPIFPPPQDFSAEVNLDVSHSDGVRIIDDEGTLDHAPDVLILPSRLKQFAKIIHSTSTVNPSFINKGTYGVISIAPRSGGTPKERMRTEIVKIEIPASATASSAFPTPTAPKAESG